MSQTAWIDQDDPRIRAAFTYALRAHVRHQSGEDTPSPAIIFADADYEVGDGSMGLHEDDKRANEPAIVYVRADAYLAVVDQCKALAERLAEIESEEQSE